MAHKFWDQFDEYDSQELRCVTLPSSFWAVVPPSASCGWCFLPLPSAVVPLIDNEMKGHFFEFPPPLRMTVVAPSPPLLQWWFASALPLRWWFSLTSRRSPLPPLRQGGSPPPPFPVGSQAPPLPFSGSSSLFPSGGRPAPPPGG